MARRFHAETRALLLLANGRFGRPLVLHQTHRNLSVPNPDFRSEMIVRDSLVHDVDCARWLLGEEIVSVQVIGPAPTRHALEPWVNGLVLPIFAFSAAAVAITTHSPTTRNIPNLLRNLHLAYRTRS